MPRVGRLVTAVAMVALLLVAAPLVVAASHQGTNVLRFAPVAGSAAPAAEGAGTVQYRGGAEPRSKWTATFEFAGLRPLTAYSVVVQGRFGDERSAEAGAFSELCSFRTDDQGAGGCWWYFRGLRRLDVAQLRLGEAGGAAVLQATRGNGAVGSIITLPR